MQHDKAQQIATALEEERRTFQAYRTAVDNRRKLEEQLCKEKANESKDHD